MASNEEQIRDLVDAYTWCTITADAPDWYVCPVYKTVLGEDGKFTKICSETPLSFAPALFDVLQSPTPPSLDFFRTLPPPSANDKIWAIYLILMEKPGEKARLYVGSGTNAQVGVRARMANYDKGKEVPRLVKAALDSGFTITHRGLLCWSPIPPEGLIPTARVRYLAVEAVFGFVFFASAETRLDGLWTSMLPWKREDVSWLPLCTHTSLMERPPGNLSMSEEELMAYNAARRLHVKQKMAIASKRAEDKQRAQDLEAYMARKRQEKLAWTKNNPERVKEIGAGVRARAKASKKHECIVCSIPLQSKTALARHLKSKAHQEQVRLAAGGAPKPVSAGTLTSQRFRERSKANGNFICSPCNKIFGHKGHLDRHNLSAKHLAKVAKASA